MPKNSQIDWDLLRRRIRRGKLTPIIGDRVGHRGFLTSGALIQKWAAKVGYPMANTKNITRVAQYRSITVDPLAAKEEFLEFLKNYLLNKALEQGEFAEDYLDTLEDEIDELYFSQVAERLKYPNFAEDKTNPLAILAQFKIPIYLTTSFHPFMAQAIQKANNAKEPRIEVCPWYDETFTKISILDADDYEDDFQNPIVYHLHGIDTEPESLVFTEDDYLDFLVRTTQDQDAHIIPARITQALADSSLLLLGYELQDWDFRVLFRGLIRSTHTARRPRSVCIQLDPEENEESDPKEIEHYLNTYFGEYKFDVYWGDIDTFAQDLWQNLGEI